MNKTIFILTIHDDLSTPEPFIWGDIKDISLLIDRAINNLKLNVGYQVEFVHISNIYTIFEFDKRSIPFDLIIDIKNILHYSQSEFEGVFLNKNDIDIAFKAFNKEADNIKGLHNLFSFSKSVGSYKHALEKYDEYKWAHFFRLNLEQ